MGANSFKRTRKDHSRENAEDYVELIEALIRERGEARTVEIAERLGISHATVSRTLQRLKREGLVSVQPYRSVFLTEAGGAMAKETRETHALVLRFLLALGVPEEFAESDAEGIEHHVSKQTIAAMRRFLNRGE